jgi:predicted ribosome quality control (RQC) complex YloA/Tae2 family protein
MNWREIEVVVRAMREQLGPGLYLERIIAPERPRFPARYLKAEWALKLRGKKSETCVVFSVRPRQPYLALYPSRAIRLAPEATRSPFDLEVVRHLKDTRLISVETLPRERIVTFWFAAGSGESGELGLVLFLIPATPEALLIDRKRHILTSTRKTRAGNFEIPGGSNAPVEPPIRAELSLPLEFYKLIDRELDLEAFALRQATAEKGLRQLLKQAKDRRRQSQASVDEAKSEPDWKRFGELMKATLPASPEPERSKGGAWVRKIKDYSTEDTIEVPADPKYTASAQTERFFQLARRKARRFEEAGIRVDGANETIERAERELATGPKAGDWAALERLERAAGLTTGPPVKTAKGKAKGAWLGKAFESKDGLPIWVGRSKDENLELTFKHARGNDLWMHVRGRPGAHVVIPLPSGKSPPLETLLDAAVLTLFYSGGEKWGKSEVDYTYKKHVKRIKDSTEASYTHNKTLMIAPDPARLKRLLGDNRES